MGSVFDPTNYIVSSAAPRHARVLINASNLHVGGGVAVASSVLTALAGIPDLAGSTTVLASTEVERNLAHMDAALQTFENYLTFDSHGMTVALRKKPVRFRDFDVVFTVFGPLYTPVIGPRNVVGFAQPWVAFPQNSAYALLTPLQRIKARFKYEVVAGFFATADVLVVEQESVREALRKRWVFRAKQIRLVPNVVDSLHFDESRWRPVTMPPRSTGLRLGVVSRNYPHKNLGILPAVKRSLRDTYGIEAEFLVTMTESEYASCSVDFRGSVTNFRPLDLAEAPSFTTQLDGVVFPTLLECYSATPIEALAVRVPLFASDRPFIRDTVGDYAYYFDPLNPESIASSIAQHFNRTAAEREKWVAGGHNYVAAQDYTSLDRALLLMSVIRESLKGDGVN